MPVAHTVRSQSLPVDAWCDDVDRLIPRWARSVVAYGTRWSKAQRSTPSRWKRTVTRNRLRQLARS